MAGKEKAIEAAKAIATGTDAKAMAKAQADQLADRKATALVPGALRKQIVKTREIKDRLDGNIGLQAKAKVETMVGQGLSGNAARAFHAAKFQAPSLLGMLGIGAAAGAAAGAATGAAAAAEKGQADATKAVAGAQGQATQAMGDAEGQAGAALAQAKGQLPPEAAGALPGAAKPPVEVISNVRSDGSVEASHETQGGALHGASEKYDPDGNIISQGYFEEGELDGPLTNYDPTGNPQQALDFTGGQLQGRNTEFDDKGRRVMNAEFHDGKMHGEALFYRDGKLAMKMHFNRGVPEGVATTYDESERPMIEQFYVDGNLNGPAKTFDGAGQLSREEQYFENMLHGRCVDYFPNGQIMRESQYIFGKRQGDCVEYYEDGSVRREEKYLNDLLEGEVIGYYPNGVVMEKSVFREGRPKGEPQRFDTHGDPMAMPGSEAPGEGKSALSKLMKRFTGD